MSIKLKQLRLNKGVTKQAFSERMGISYRTVTNWEKPNGVIPSLETITYIASFFEVPTFTIYDCFMNDLDCSEDNADDMHNEALISTLNKYNSAKNKISLLSFLVSKRINTNGFINYHGHVFCFSKMDYRESSTDIFGDENNPFIIRFPTAVVLSDNMYNLFIIDESSSISWDVLSEENGNLSLSVLTTKPLIPEMTEEIKTNGNASFQLTFFMSSNINKPSDIHDFNYMIRKEKDKVIGSYISAYRKRNKKNQEELSDVLSRITGKKIKKSTISKWENGFLFPSLIQLQALCIVLGMSEEKLLRDYDDCVFATYGVNRNSFAYNIGLNHIFDTVNDLESFRGFLKAFIIAKDGLGFSYDDSHLCYIVFSDSLGKSVTEHEVSNISITNDMVQLSSEDGVIDLSLPRSCIKSIEPYSLHENYMYEFRGLIVKDTKEVLFSVSFSYFM